MIAPGAIANLTITDETTGDGPQITGPITLDIDHPRWLPTLKRLQKANADEIRKIDENKRIIAQLEGEIARHVVVCDQDRASDQVAPPRQGCLMYETCWPTQPGSSAQCATPITRSCRTTPS